MDYTKAIEFETTYKDGIIKVPNEPRNNIFDAPIRVILLQHIK